MRISSNRDELHQIAAAAHLYYEEGYTQQETADIMGLSRPTVSRLLIRAKEEQIVTIIVKDPFDIDERLSAQLCENTSLNHAIVTRSVPGNLELNLKRFSIFAAEYLEQDFLQNDVVGVGWGRTLYSVLQSLRQESVENISYVPLIGGLGQVSPQFQVHELIRIMSERLGGEGSQLILPAIVQHKETRDRLLALEDSRIVIDQWDNLTKAIIGIGNVDFDSDMKILFMNYIDESARLRLKSAGAVGDICMYFFDKYGNEIQDGMRWLVSIPLEKIKKIPNVIAVACGVSKASAILGAIRGNYIHTLITDDITAKAIVSIKEAEEKEYGR